MADRVVKVTLRAQVDEYKRGMVEAANATRTTGTEAEKLAQKRQAFEMVGRASLVAGGAIAAGLGIAIGKYAEFDQAMSNVLATGDDARENQDALREAALEAGAATVFSATESANAIEELSKAGLSASDILGGGLTGSLDLAAAGGLGVAEAAEIAATTLQQFRLRGDQASHVADLLAAGAGKAMGDVTDLSGALNQAGLVANQFGLSVEETVGTLSAFASAGMLGSDAGTSMRTMLLRLANPTKEVTELMEQLGIEAYDSQGQFIGLAGLAGELETSLAGMTDAQRDQTLAMIFGQDAIRGANILLREGKDGIEEWTAAVDDQGYAAETAAQRLDNLKGDWEAFTGALDTGLISLGEAANGPLRFLVQTLTEMVDGFNELPVGAQQAIFWVGAAAAAAMVAGGVYLLAIPKVAEYRAALATLGTTAQRTGRLLGTLARVGAVGAAVGTAVIGVDALSEAIAKNLLPSADKIDNKMRQAKSGVDLFMAAVEKEGMQSSVDSASKLLRQLGSELDAVADSTFWDGADTSWVAVSVAKELAEIAESGDMALFSAQFRKLGEDANLTGKQMRTYIRDNPELENALIKQATAAGLGSDAHTLLKIALGETGDAAQDSEAAIAENEAALASMRGEAEDASGTISDLADIIRDFGSATLDSRAAQREFEQAVDDAQAALEEHGATLDINTQAGRDNQAALDEIARASNDAAAAILFQTGSEEEATAALQRGRDELYNKARAFGMSEEAAAAYADSVIADMGEVKSAVEAIPGSKNTHLTLTGVSEAEAQLQHLARERWARVHAMVVAPNTVDPGAVLRANGYNSANFQGNLYDSGKAQAFASGGFASGIYPGVLGGIHKFAESEMGVPWEAYISGRAADRDRNIGIAYEALNRLGAGPQASQVVIEGARITGSLDLGNGLVGVIDGRIADAKYRSAVKITGGGVSA